MWDGFSHNSSPNPNGFRKLVARKIHLTWNTMQNTYHITWFSHLLHPIYLTLYHTLKQKVCEEFKSNLRWEKSISHGKPYKIHMISPEEVHVEDSAGHEAGKYIEEYGDEDTSQTCTFRTVKMPIQLGAVCYWVSSSLVLIPLEWSVN